MEPPRTPDYCPSDKDRLATANELLRLAERYLDTGELAKAAQTLAQAEEIVTELAKKHAAED